MGKREMPFWSAEEVEGFLGGEGDGESAGFGEADVFAGHADQATSEIQSVFTGFEHAGEPIEGGVGIGVAHGFVKGGDEIEVFFASLVVAEEFALEEGFEEVWCDLLCGWSCSGTRRRADLVIGVPEAFRTKFQGVVSGAGIAIGEGGDAEENIVGDGDVFVAEAAVGVGEGAFEEFDDLGSRVGFEDVDLGAREKRGDNLEGGIFRGGADEENVAGFDVGEEGVLLGFVEAVDFIHEDDGALAGTGFAFGVGHDFLDFFYAGGDGAEGDEFGFGEAGDESCEGGFAAAGRSPEEHGGEIVGFDLDAKGLAGGKEFFLADEFVEGAGTHAFGEGLEGRGGFGFGE